MQNLKKKKMKIIMMTISIFTIVTIFLIIMFNIMVTGSQDTRHKVPSNIKNLHTKKYKNLKFKDTVLSKEDFKKRFKKLGWFINPFYASQVWDEYEQKQNEKYRQVLNRYLLSHGKNYLRNYVEDSFGTVFEHAQNVTIHIYGKKGMGKSFIARGFAHKMCKILEKNPNYHLDVRNLDDHQSYILNDNCKDYHNIYQTYNFSQTRMIFKTLLEHEVLIQDEMPEDRGRGSKNVMKDIKNSLKIVTRAKLCNMIFLNTSMVKMADIDLFVEALAINEKKGLNLCVLAVLSKDKKRIVYEGIAILKLKEPESLTKWYQKTSRRMKTEVQEQGGGSSAEWITEKEDIEFLLTYVTQQGKKFLSEKEFYSYILREKGLRNLKNSCLFLNELVTTVWGLLQTGDVENKFEKIDTNKELGNMQFNDIKKFEITEEKYDELYELYIKEANNITEISKRMKEEAKRKNRVEMYKAYANAKKFGFTQDDLLNKFKNALGGTLTQTAFSKNINIIKGWLNDVIGKLYEKHLALQLMKKYEGKFIKILYWENTIGTSRELGKQGEPDILVYFKDDYEGFPAPIIPGRVWVISVKCYCPGLSRKSVSIPIGELKPEIDECQRIHDLEPDKNPFLRFAFYNRNGNYDEQIESYWRKLDWMDLAPSLTITLKKKGK